MIPRVQVSYPSEEVAIVVSPDTAEAIRRKLLTLCEADDDTPVRREARALYVLLDHV